MRTKPLYCLHYTRLSFKMLCKNGNSISVIQWVWDYPQNIKTERFGSQPERSVFPVWVLTGFACGQTAACKFVGNLISGFHAEIVCFDHVRGIGNADGKCAPRLDVLHDLVCLGEVQKATSN